MENLLTPKDYQIALDAQSAVNLSGIVIAFSKVMDKICNEARKNGHGTDWKNQHPIARLYATQIEYLALSKDITHENSYGKAHEICTERSKELVSS